MPKDMSWLSPKRRRTTGALPTIQNATVNGLGDESGEPESPRIGRPKRAPTTPKSERPPPSRLFPTPSPSTTSSNGFASGMSEGAGDGNLFYAYARKADDLRSRFLLTFASAAIANEWWALLQTHFPDCMRPGPQLFSFKSDDLLAKAWKHAAFAHLKSKWMYIQFNDAGNLGGAAQGIIPLQDAAGNLLGGSAAGSPEQLGQMRREARNVKNELGALEQHFERMMEAVERNTEQIAALAEERKESEVARAKDAAHERNGANGSGEPHFDISELSGHLGRISDLLERNSAHVEALAKRQHESEQKLREALEETKAQKRSDYLDMSQLSAHLDRIQGLMEKSMHERKDSARDIKSSPPRVDFSPLTDRLEKVLGAVEQNSDLVARLLERDGVEKQLSNDRLGKKLDELIELQKENAMTSPREPLELDVSPLSQRLDDLLDAQEATSSKQQAAGDKTTRVLEKILDTQHKAIDRGPFDVSLLSQRLDEILSVHRDAATTPLVGKLDDLLKAHNRLAEREALDMSPLTSRLDDLLAEVATSRDAIDFLPVVEQLNGVRASTEGNSEQISQLVEAQRVSNNTGTPSLDLQPLTEHLQAILEATKQNSEQTLQALANAKPPPLDFSPLTNQLQALRTATAKTNTHLTNLLKSQSDDRQALITTSNNSTAVDFTPLSEKLAHIHTTLENQHDRSPGIGDAKFIMSALTSHLSKIQAVTESNAVAVRALREKQSASQDKMHIAVAETSEQVRSLSKKSNSLEAQVGVREGQVRELVRAQNEMVESVRALALAIKDEKKGCGHVVVPPPRKTGKKVVGFVYEGFAGK